MLNNSSWWATQKPYKETEIIKATVHTTDAVTPACPTSETSNESTSFSTQFQGVGLAAGYAKFYIFIQNEQSGLTADMSILNPNGSNYLSWTYNSTASNKVLMRGFSKKLPTSPGTYTFKATYNGKTCSSTFQIYNPLSIDENKQNDFIALSQNPSEGKIILELSGDIENGNSKSLNIYNLMGALIHSSEISSSKTELDLELSEEGLYFFKITDGDKTLQSGKLMMQ